MDKMDTELSGIRNGHEVNSMLYRGGNVELGGAMTLQGLGIGLVISLKNAKQDSASEMGIERRDLGTYGIEYINVPMDSSGIFSYDDGRRVPEILDLISNAKGKDNAQAKVFVHCAHGSDRSGVVVACYRIKHGWDAERAIKEMKKYGSAWYNFGMRSAVKSFKP